MKLALTNTNYCLLRRSQFSRHSVNSALWPYGITQFWFWFCLTRNSLTKLDALLHSPDMISDVQQYWQKYNSAFKDWVFDNVEIIQKIAWGAMKIQTLKQCLHHLNKWCVRENIYVFWIVFLNQSYYFKRHLLNWIIAPWIWKPYVSYFFVISVFAQYLTPNGHF